MDGDNVGHRPTMMTTAMLFEFHRLKRLLNKASVAVSPDIGFGKYGDGFVRIALVENEYRSRQAIRNIRRFMQDDKDMDIGDNEVAAAQ